MEGEEEGRGGRKGGRETEQSKGEEGHEICNICLTYNILCICTTDLTHVQ